MKKIIRILLVFCFIFLLVGCSSSDRIKDVSFSKLKSMINNKETFILEIMQDGCSHCQEFKPKFEDVLKENDLTAYSINLAKLSEEDSDELSKIYSFDGTPTVIFVKDGVEEPIIKRIVGSKSRDEIRQKLKNAGFIK